MTNESTEASASPENERLRQELRRLSSIVDSSPNPVWQHDGELKISYCNEQFTELADPDSEELVDFSQLELFIGHRGMVKEALESGEEQQSEQYLISGGKRSLYRISEVPTSEGMVNGFAVNISETEEAREEVQRHVRAQRNFLDSTTSAMAVFGRDQRLMFYNAAFVRTWRLEEHFLDTCPSYGDILEALRERRALPEQSNFPAFKAAQLRWFTDLIEPHEEFLYLPDDKILRVVHIPHALGGLLIAYEDVTDRLALERSYNTLIAVQQETLENIHEAVCVIGEDGRAKLTNPPFLRLWNIAEALANSEPRIRDTLERCRELIPADDWEEYKETFMAKLYERKTSHGVMELTDGRVVGWRKVPLPDGGTLLAQNDITDSARLERSLRERNLALEAADRLKTEFLANVSYELRSPLTSISGFSDILRNNYFGELNVKQAEYVEGIHQSANQLEALISNILDLASIEAGYMQLDVSEFDIFEMAESIMSVMSERGKVLRLQLSLSCDRSIGTMLADETRIKQILSNLLNNAIKYSQGEGGVFLNVSLDADDIVFCVSDEGVGIEPDKLEHIFERFHRSGASSGQQSGTGLGLSIVKSFVELHGGSVSVVSKPGEGSHFTCRLPQKCTV